MSGMESVIGLDCSTSAVKAIAFDRTGAVLATGRARVPCAPDAAGRFEQDPEDWWRATCTALAELARGMVGIRVVALAVANQRETIAPLDAAFQAVRPAILWLDGRARDDAAGMAAALGEDLLHRVTGKVPDPNP